MKMAEQCGWRILPVTARVVRSYRARPSWAYMRELSETTTSSTTTEMSLCCENRSNIADLVASPAQGARWKNPSIDWQRSVASVLPVLGSLEKTHVVGKPCPSPVCPAHTLVVCKPATAIANVACAGSRLFLKKAGMSSFQTRVAMEKRT